MSRIIRALSIKQPFVDQIVRGKKSIEYRTKPTKIINEPIYIYASKKYRTDIPGYSAEQLKSLPVGVIVGTVKISKCVRSKKFKGIYEWHLLSPKKLKKYLKPKRHPQPVWFKPF